MHQHIKILQKYVPMILICFYTFHMAIAHHVEFLQEALLWQKDCTTCLSVEILQLQNIPFEN